MHQGHFILLLIFFVSYCQCLQDRKYVDDSVVGAKTSSRGLFGKNWRQQMLAATSKQEEIKNTTVVFNGIAGTGTNLEQNSSREGKCSGTFITPNLK